MLHRRKRRVSCALSMTYDGNVVAHSGLAASGDGMRPPPLNCTVRSNCHFFSGVSYEAVARALYRLVSGLRISVPLYVDFTSIQR